MTANPITFAGDRMAVLFDSFGIDSYRRFLSVKQLPEYTCTFDRDAETYTIDAPARFAALLGIEPPVRGSGHLPLPAFMYDDQRYLVDTALDAKRFAVWSGCGNGKTLIGLEFARQVQSITAGRVLIVTLNQIVPEWIDEARRWYGDSLPIVRLETRAEMREWCANDAPGIGITNYEKFNPDADGQVVNECRSLAGIVLDESSRLKTGGGKQKWAIIKSFKGLEYKLSLTATPAPNDVMEFASQASFLEKMRSEGEILWTYFTRDPKTQEWTVKPHAREAFFKFMASWSIYVNDPKRYGWRLNVPDVPRPEIITVEVAATPEQLQALLIATANVKTGQMSLLPDAAPNAIQRVKLSQVAKGFRYAKRGGKRVVDSIRSNKPMAVAGLVRGEVAIGEKVLLWTEFDEESRILAALLAEVPGVLTLTGSTPKPDRAGVIEQFRTGNANVLITRAKMVGFGLNFQCVGAMVFSGWTDSFESMYQSIRRAVRHGQTKPVRVYFPVVNELEGDVLRNVRRKEIEFEQAIAEMELSYLAVIGKERAA